MAKKFCWLRRLFKVMVVLAVLLAAGCVAGKYWLIPAAVRWQLRKQLPKYWHGEGTVDEIEFSFFGPIHLRGLSLRDDDGRQWLHVGSVTLTLRDFPGLHPVLTGVEVQDVVVRGHVAGGRLVVPLKPLPDERPDIDKYVSLRNVSVKPITVALVDDRGNAIAWEDIEFKLLGPLPAKHPHYTFSLSRKKKDEDQTLVCDGVTFVATSKSRANLAVSHRLDAEQIEGIRAILSPADSAGRGGALADVLGELVKPKVVAGLLEGALRVQAAGTDPNTLRGRGQLRLTNIRVKRGFGWVARLLAAEGIDLGNQVRSLEAAFHVRGTRIVFDALNVRNDVGSLSVEAGGWIDLSPAAKRQVDLYVVAVANDDVKNILSKIPVAKWGVLAADKLTRVRVSGRWDDPPGKLIRREPIRDLAEGTLEVLRGIAGTGSDVREGAVRTIGELLKFFNGNAKPDKPK